MAEEAEAVEVEEVEIDPRYELYSEWLEEQTGVEIEPLHLQLSIRYYAKFQRSDENKEYNKERSAARKEALEEHRERVDAKKAEKEQRKAERAAKREEAQEKPAKKAAAKKAARPLKSVSNEDAKPARRTGRGRSKPAAEAAF